MPSETILDLLTPLLLSGLGALFWTRLNRLETGQEAIKAGIARIWERMATREELDRLSERVATRDDIARVQEEMGGMRGEMAVMRSDLTHVALAVGASRPRPADGETSAN